MTEGTPNAWVVFVRKGFYSDTVRWVDICELGMAVQDNSLTMIRRSGNTAADKYPSSLSPDGEIYENAAL